MPRIERAQPLPSPRLSRAALIFAGAAAVSACGKTADTGSTSSSGANQRDRGPAPAYGGPPPSFFDGGATTATPPPVPPPDAAPATDAGAPRDARDR